MLDHMSRIGRELAEALGGKVVDDNRVEANDTGLAQIREQLRTIHAAMAARGIAGGDRALRLFSYRIVSR